MSTFKEIEAQIAQLQRQAAEQRDREIADALKTIHDLMQEYSISIGDLQLVRKKGAFKKSSKPLFRNPKTGNTWSGRGRMPNWLIGQDNERFRI
jgi:DNA-binding protein H-NS